MSVTFHPPPKFRLTQLLARQGGVTVAEAIERAEAGLAAIADPCRLALMDALDRLDEACGALLATPEDGRLRAAYKAADHALGLAGPAEQPELGAAAYSLCELLDRFQSGAPFKSSAVQVHRDALGLLRRPPAESGGEFGRRAVLDGLHRVVQTV